MKDTETMGKIIIPIAAFFSGIILFLTFAAVLINNTVFNDNYHIDILTRLDLQDYISETAKVRSSEIFSDQEQINSYINNNLSSELVNTNIKSLVTGLLDYIKGKRSVLPDLYLRASSASDARSAVDTPETDIPGNNGNQPDSANLLSSSFSKLTAIEKINMRLLVMFSDEQKIESTLLVFSKAQFVIKNIIVPLILLYILIIIFLLRHKPSGILAFSMCSTLNCAALCILTCINLYKLRNMDLHNILSLQNIPFPEIREILNNYALSFLDNFIYNLLLNSVILAVGATVIYYTMYKLLQTKNGFSRNIHVSEEASLPKGTSLFEELSLFEEPSPFKEPSLAYHVLAVMLMTVLYIHLNIAVNEYHDRGLNRKSEYLSASISRDLITDARNHDICYLEVIVLDSISLEPLEGAEITICKADSPDFAIKGSFTGSEGSSPFLLEKGSYRLMLDTAGTQTDWNYPDIMYLDFDLLKPGKNELKIITEKQIDGHIRIQSSAIQYLP